MSYTFICTPEKEWWLKITKIEDLLDYWNEVFNPRLKQALDTIRETKEFGRSMQHADIFQLLIGMTANGEHTSWDESYEKIIYDTRIAQYQSLLNNNAVYINKKFGWNSEEKVTVQFIHKSNFEFPIMEKDRLKIKQFPMGNHYYAFIDGVQLRKDENLKFNSYDEAYNFAQQYIKR